MNLDGLLREKSGDYAQDKLHLLRGVFLAIPIDELFSFVKLAREIPYKTYLKTIYWGVIRGTMLALHPECQACRSSGRLQVHHLRYLHRGFEIFFLEDLQVVCGTCHMERHDLADEDRLKKMFSRRTFAHFRGSKIQPHSNGLLTPAFLAEVPDERPEDEEIITMLSEVRSGKFKEVVDQRDAYEEPIYLRWC